MSVTIMDTTPAAVPNRANMDGEERKSSAKMRANAALSQNPSFRSGSWYLNGAP
jgi:hypothetical protein